MVSKRCLQGVIGVYCFTLVLSCPGKRWLITWSRLDFAYWPLSVSGWLVFRGGGRSDQVQVCPKGIFQKQGKTICPIWKKLQESASTVTGMVLLLPWENINLHLSSN